MGAGLVFSPRPAHPTRMVEVFLALGSNLGDRQRSIEAALRALASLPGTRILASSTLIETDPVGPMPQGRYLNGVLRLETTLPPRALLEAILRVEADLGRDRARSERWGPRTIDLDILLYGNLELDEPGLTLPHPRIAERRFVLGPLAELAPELIVPGLGVRVRDLLAMLIDSESARCS